MSGKHRAFRAVGQLALLVLIVASSGCYSLRRSAGGGQTDFTPPRMVDSADVALSDGYKIEVVAEQLTFPTGIAFDGSGRVLVTESGYSYGDVWLAARLIRFEPDGRQTVLAEANDNNGPWNGLAYHDGFIYVAEGGVREGGRILRFSETGKRDVLISGLPSGDHHTNGPVVGPDGWLYFSQGSVTNSGVVGPDNADHAWLKLHPEMHDVPGEIVVLRGANFESEDIFGEGRIRTGAFSAFGKPMVGGETREGGRVPSGSIVRIPLGGGEPELVAWGFRNPFGMVFAENGDLFATDHGYDNRGSRPVWGAPDLLWKVSTGSWHGWPDFSGNRPLTDDDFRPPGGEPLEFLLPEFPNQPPTPIARLDVHGGASGLDVSRSREFGFEGELFIALFGDLAPAVNRVLAPVGFKIVRVDPETGRFENFAVNRGGQNGPASRIGGKGFERPVAVRFGPDVNSLYVVDFGVLTLDGKKHRPHEKTGVIWKISRKEVR